MTRSDGGDGEESLPRMGQIQRCIFARLSNSVVDAGASGCQITTRPGADLSLDFCFAREMNWRSSAIHQLIEAHALVHFRTLRPQPAEMH